MMILKKKIREFMQSNVITCLKDTPIIDVAILMDSKNIGSVIITDKDRVVGIITERDITHRLYIDNDLSKLTAKDIMTNKVSSINPDANIGEAIKILFENRIRRLPIIKNGKLLGIITSTDICQEINNPHACTTVGEIMRKNIETLSEDETVYNAVGYMLDSDSSTGRRGVGHIIIQKQGKILGIITERDIIKYIVVKKRDLKKTNVCDIMSTDIITIQKDVVVCHAAELLNHYKFRHLPVIDEDEKLISTITQTDLIEELKKEYEEKRI